MHQLFELAELQARQAAGDRRYLEFLRVPSLSTGLYVLPAGDTDPQQPHAADEIYYIISGRARFTVAEDDYLVQAGSVIYVSAQVPHRFHSIEADLTILVLFAPPEPR